MTFLWFAWIFCAFLVFALVCDRVAQTIMTRRAAPERKKSSMTAQDMCKLTGVTDFMPLEGCPVCHRQVEYAGPCDRCFAEGHRGLLGCLHGENCPCRKEDNLSDVVR